MDVSIRARTSPAHTRTPVDRPAARAAFDAEVERWLARVYRFATARVASAAEAEAVTRATLLRAYGEGVLPGPGERAARVLALLKAELARRGGDSHT